MTYDKMVEGMVSDIPNSPRNALYPLLAMACELAADNKISAATLINVRKSVKFAFANHSHA